MLERDGETGSGVGDIDDAAVAAANYRCRASGEDMVSQDGWRTGIAGYLELTR